MQLEVKENCPLNSFKPCKKLDCSWFVKMAGQDPNTGKQIDEYGCAVAWLPVMLIENAHQSRQTGAAVESFRNEMVRQNEQSHDLLSKIQKPNLIDLIEVKQ
jgi:hypothetical protein